MTLIKERRKDAVDNMKIFKAFLIFCLVLASVGVKIIFFPQYESQTLFLANNRVSPTSIEQDKDDIKLQMFYLRNHVELMQSDVILRKVVEQLKLDEDIPIGKGVSTDFLAKEKRVRRCVDILRRSLSVENPPFTNIIKITVRYKSPLSADIANALARSYIRWRVELSIEDANTVVNYLDQKVAEAKDKLQIAENDLQRLKTQNSIASLPEDAKDYPKFFSAVTLNNPGLQTLENQLLSALVEQSQLEELYTAQSPQVIHLKERIAMLTENRKNALEKNMQLINLIREVQIAENAYLFLVQEAQKAKLSLAKKTTEDIKVISVALPPVKPFGRMKTLFMGIVFAFLVAGGYLFFGISLKKGNKNH